MEDDDVSSIDELEAQVLGHDVRREPLAARDDVLGRVLLDVLGEGLELLGHGPGDPQLVRDVDEALLDVGEQRGAVDVVLNVGVDEKEQVGNLVVAVKAPSDGGDHDELAVGIGVDDCLDLLELLGGCDAGAAELRDLDHA